MRYLGRAKPKDAEYDYITVDIETGKDKKHGSALLGETVYVSWCIDGKGYGEKTNDLSFWLLEHFLISELNGYILYAHNGFGFDFKRVDWKLIASYGFVADFLTGNDGSIKSITFRDDYEHEWIIRDSLLLIPRKLDDVTKKFAPKYRKLKREVSFDVLPFNPDNADDVAYAIQDSIGLYHAIDNVDSILRNRFNVSIHEAATLPGLAFRAFRLMFKQGNRKEGIEGEKYPGISFGCAIASRESYHGGQTIAFKTNAIRDVISLDANSMYSFVMLDCGLPTGNYKRVAGLPRDSNPDKVLCLAVCHIPNGVFPLLKTKSKSGSTGNYKGIVTGWYWLFELEKQRELGGDFEVIESYVWESETWAAKRFVELCKQLRMTDYFGPVGEIAKLLANALYGKFAQQVAEFTLMLSEREPECEAIPLYNPTTRETVPGLWNVKGRKNFSADMTHWASFITAKARMVLNDAIQKLGYDKVIYCDTDSIFLERKYLSLLYSVMGKEYGQFKIEKGKANKGIPFQAVAPKAYLFIDERNKVKVKNKGIPTKAIEAQDGIARMGEPEQAVQFISSNNMMQMLKSDKEYGRLAHRRMATVDSTTNGIIENDSWEPVECEYRTVEDLRGDSVLLCKTPFYIKQLFSIVLSEYETRKGSNYVRV